MKKDETLDDTLLDLNDVINKVKIKKATIYAKIKAGEFPKPVKIGSRSLWPLSSINCYINNLKKANAA